MLDLEKLPEIITCLCGRVTGSPMGENQYGYALFYNLRGKPHKPFCWLCRRDGLKEGRFAAAGDIYSLPNTLRWVVKKQEQKALAEKALQERQEQFVAAYAMDSKMKSPFEGVSFSDGDPEVICPLCQKPVDLTRDHPYAALKTAGSKFPTVVSHGDCIREVRKAAEQKGIALKFFYPLERSRERDRKMDERNDQFRSQIGDALGRIRKAS